MPSVEISMSEAERAVWRSEKLRAVLASTLVLPLGVALISPALPVIRDNFALSDARTSLIITVYFLPGIVFSPIIGLLADRFGRRTVIIPSLVGFGLVGGAIAVVDAFALVLALRFVQGVAAAGVFILTVTFISDVFDGVERNTALGLNSAVLLAGAAVFPFLGGILALIDWHVPFVTYLVALPIALYAFPRLAGSPVVQPKTGPEYLRGAAAALPPIEAGALYGATVLLETIVFGAILTALPFVLASEFGASSAVTGTIITATMFAGCVVAVMNGRFSRRRSNHRLVALSFWCFAAGLLVAWIGSTTPVVLAGAAIVGAGYGLARPSVDAAIGRLAPAEYRAGALSIRNATTFLGRGVGPIAFTSAALVTGYRPLLFGFGVGTLAIGIVGLVLTDGETRVGHEPASQ